MIGRTTAKHMLKRTAGIASTLLHPFVARPGQPSLCILAYHRVAPVPFIDPRFDNWNVMPDAFEKQIAALAGFADIVALSEVPFLLGAAPRPSRARPLVCLTFDDGFASFRSEALPILQRYGAKATLFVVTRFVGSPDPMPFDRWSRRHRDRVAPAMWRAVTWDDVEHCLASGLVTIGSHSHEHRIGSDCTPDELRHEAEASRDVLRARLGRDLPLYYSYPYGSSRPAMVPAAYISAVEDAGYALAVSTDLGLAHQRSHRFFLPRVEAFGLDSAAVLRAKADGVLGPHAVPQWFRSATRSA
jgi:peptidoglycan/xylan/chitin deacetylase (PgdA/CDA1 family)